MRDASRGGASLRLRLLSTKAQRDAACVPSHLAAFAGVHTVVKAGRDVATHLAQKHHTSGLCGGGTYIIMTIIIIRETNTVIKGLAGT